MDIRRLTAFSLLIATALILGYFERILPITPGLPGIKLGLGNIVLLYALYRFSTREVLLLMMAKTLLTAVAFAGFGSFLYSFVGAVSALMVMITVKNFLKASIVGVSVSGGVFHNIGQLTAASIIVQTRALTMYFPILLISGITTGILTGLVAKSLIQALEQYESA